MRRLCGLLFLPLVACGSSSSVTKPADPVTTATSAPSAARVPSVSGTLVGHDGKPMKLAHVSIGDQHVVVGADGSFTVRVADRGFAKVAFTGVDHGDRTVGVLIGDEPVAIDVVLGTYERPTEYKAPTVVQIVFNDDETIGMGKAVPMKPAGDGTFVAEIAAVPGEFAYELRGIVSQPGRSMNSTEATEYRYDGDGNYANVVTAGRRSGPGDVRPRGSAAIQRRNNGQVRR